MRVVETKRFSKTLKKLLANGLDGRLVADAVQWLVNGRQPPCPAYRDHALGNNLKMWRDCTCVVTSCSFTKSKATPSFSS